jgi:hypothetical protein
MSVQPPRSKEPNSNNSKTGTILGSVRVDVVCCLIHVGLHVPADLSAYKSFTNGCLDEQVTSGAQVSWGCDATCHISKSGSCTHLTPPYVICLKAASALLPRPYPAHAPLNVPIQVTWIASNDSYSVVVFWGPAVWWSVSFPKDARLQSTATWSPSLESKVLISTDTPCNIVHPIGRKGEGGQITVHQGAP